MRADLQEFARLLVRHVRDEAISSLDAQLARPDSATNKRWAAAAVESVHEAKSQLASEAVDEAVGYLLIAIDQGLVPLGLRLETEWIDLAVAGQSEMAGSYMGNDGWRDLYSGERVIDYYAIEPK